MPPLRTMLASALCTFTIPMAPAFAESNDAIWHEGRERLAFLQEAAKDGLIEKAEFTASSKRGDGFVPAGAKWSEALVHDRNGDGRLSWFEARAWRRGESARAASGPAKPSPADRKAGAKEKLRAVFLDPDKPILDPHIEMLDQIEIPAVRRFGIEKQQEWLARVARNGFGRPPAGTPPNPAWEAMRAEMVADVRRQEALVVLADLDGNGRIDGPAERDVLDRMRWGFREMRLVQSAIRTYDTDGNGTVSDFERKILEAQLHASVLSKADTDRDGRLDAAEYNVWARTRPAILQVIRTGADGADIEQTPDFRDFDLNRDGAIDPFERISVMKLMHESSSGGRGVFLQGTF